ncbi:MAG: hypothetical protein J6M43_00205 [Neisseriaceae bacterium]|nr:hypothetical protein [Neisseriaceae bacterium]
MINELLIKLGTELTALTTKGTIAVIGDKIKAYKEIKDAEELKGKYGDIINQIIQEREDAIRIARTYQAELERIVISDDDIKHLHNTISRLLDLIKPFAPQTGDIDIDTFKDLINADTLKTMQLLGFNYKEAIGEPLTKLCADKISSFGEKQARTNNQKNRK